MDGGRKGREGVHSIEGRGVTRKYLRNGQGITNCQRFDLGVFQEA